MAVNGASSACHLLDTHPLLTRRSCSAARRLPRSEALARGVARVARVARVGASALATKLPVADCRRGAVATLRT